MPQKVNERMDSDEPYEGKKHKLRTILQSQARHVATFVRGENPPVQGVGGEVVGKGEDCNAYDMRGKSASLEMTS